MNTFHFEKTPVVTADYGGHVTIVDNFYRVANGAAGQAVKGIMAAGVMSGNVNYLVYNLDDPEPRVPRYDQVWATGAGGFATQAALPEEVALCLSYEALPESGVAQARRRGRIYAGPLTLTSLLTTADGRVTTAAGLAASLGVQMKGLRDAAIGISSNWIVYSPTQAQFGLDPSAVIQQGWVDNAFDTQRRRGVEATVRSRWGPG